MHYKDLLVVSIVIVLYQLGLVPNADIDFSAWESTWAEIAMTGIVVYYII